MAAQVGPECAILRPATIFAECQKTTTFSVIIAAKERLSLGSPKSRARLTAIRRRKKATRGRSCSGEATTEASDACADQRKARAQGHRACSTIAPVGHAPERQRVRFHLANGGLDTFHLFRRVAGSKICQNDIGCGHAVSARCRGGECDQGFSGRFNS